MTSYRPGRGYSPDLDVRFAGGTPPEWATHLLTGRPPNDWAYPVVVGRRGGKTWFANGLAASAGRLGSSCRVFDLRSSVSSLASRVRGIDIAVIDEPGAPSSDTTRVLSAARDSGTVVILLLSPGEWMDMRRRGLVGVDAAKDLLFLPALADLEIDRFAMREPAWAPLVADLRRTAPRWFRTAFLAELIFETAELSPASRDDPKELLSMAERRSEQSYRRAVFDNGLDESLRAAFRWSRWQIAAAELGAADEDSLELLRRTHTLADPLLAQALPDEVRVHHLSDLHFGGSLAQTVDMKTRNAVGEGLAETSGGGTPIDRYLSYLGVLKASGNSPHLIVVTGDIVDRTLDRYGQAAGAFLRECTSLLAPHPLLDAADPRVLLVGGNHDVDWFARAHHEDRSRRHEWFDRQFAAWPHPRLSAPSDERQLVVVDYRKLGVRFALLGSSELGGQLIPSEAQEHQLRELLSEFDSPDEPTEAEWRFVLEQIERVDPAVLHQDVIDRLGELKGSTAMTVALVHHPVASVPDIEVAQFSGLLNAGSLKAACARAGVGLVLHGHAHRSWIAVERWPLLRGTATLRSICAPSLAGAYSPDRNGFNEIALRREGERTDVGVRPVFLDGVNWVSDQFYFFVAGSAVDVVGPSTLRDRPGRSAS